MANEPGLNEEQRIARRQQNINSFRLQCLDFYITAADQLKLYLPLNSEILREAVFIDPAVALSKEARVDNLPDLTHLYRQFKVCK